MSFHFKMNLILKFFCCIVILPNIKSDCVMEYTNNINIAPKFERVMGKFKIKIPFGGHEHNYIKVQAGSTVHGYCESYFSPITYETVEETETYDYYKRYKTVTTRVEKQISSQTALVFKCHDTTLFYNDYKLLDQNLSCLEPTWSIYSTKRPYNWCKSNQNSTTFLLAAQKGTKRNVLAAICYNIDQMSLQTLVYNTTNFKNNYVNQPVDANNMISSEYIDEHLWNFKTSIVSDLSVKDLQKTLNDLGKTDQWLNLANYEVSPIVQKELLMKYFKECENILNIIWWHNLRVGNWKRFQNLLTNHALNNSYELYKGTSGVAQYPTDDKCDKERYLEVKFGYQNQTAPAYIWTYLKSNDNLNKEFVMVGYNSPYAEYFKTEEVIFCPDICSEIPWLKPISATFRYTSAGIMFCCSTDFIRQTNYLQGFPIEILLPQQITTIVATTTTAMEESTTEYFTDI